ncbi:efflux RND transporter periplasmic adaptor subunit [Rubrivivax sp. RP6-9]|uniref:efflux RND transporter periplasmic adaptor subunit n=1 Tax=Rubrivivax sp. RP6-9 TaxID=3415750 RepID=UPI003CC6D405
MQTSSSPLAQQRRSLTGTLATAGLAVAAAAVLAACAPAVTDVQAGPSAAAAVPSVPVARVRSAAAVATATQVARVEAAQHVELRARVSGPIDAVLFREGDLVRAGQPLFQIDPQPYDAALARARAEVQLARAREAWTAAEAERARQLQADRAIAVEEMERRVAAHAEAQARRAGAEAALQTAQLERDFTLVRAPIDGRIGRALVTTGNFVSAGGGTTALATLVGVARLHVHIDVADRGLLQRLADDGGARGWKARVLDADGQRELAQAPIDFTNHSVDAATGTVRLRGRIDAPTPALMPGQYVRVQIATGAAQPVLLVPDKAIGTDQGRRFVLVVDAAGMVGYRPVDVGAAQGSDRIVTRGLQAGEQVIVSGLMRVRPGMTVSPQPSTGPVAPQALDRSGPVPDRT